MGAQNSVNQFDNNGERHGIWTKNYHNTNQKRYEGTFVHGKEVGEFKYYTLKNGKSVLSAIKVFNEKDSTASVKFLASNGKIISEGNSQGKKSIGKWIYYHKNSEVVMITENYNDQGELTGERTVYYKNGQVAERALYKNGLLHGLSEWFSDKGKLIKSSVYENDDLNGLSINNDSNGNISSKGRYEKNKKVDVWEYYTNGKLIKTINHTTQEVFPVKD